MNGGVKVYKVSWRSPSHEGEFDIATENVTEVAQMALDTMFPPAECPTILTKIELVEPEQYLPTPKAAI